ncbi:MAG: ATP-binding protein [Thermoanaerobaculia bacterium]|nr:ATP-binding protein [Thermoanaerobaculia bacterium]
MSSPPQVHLSIGSSVENVELVQLVVEEALNRLDLDPDDAHWVGIAVREAVANAVKHGNRHDPGKRVALDFGVEDGELVIRVCDEGGGFDPEGVDNPLAPENVLKPSGRGIFYMKRFMDEIDYSFGPDGGTVVTMRKHLDSEHLDSASGPSEDQEKEQEEEKG